MFRGFILLTNSSGCLENSWSPFKKNQKAIRRVLSAKCLVFYITTKIVMSFNIAFWKNSALFLNYRHLKFVIIDQR